MIEPPRPRPLIIDCDPGTDDAIALLLALASPELHVAAITVAGGNAPLPQTLANARAVAALAGAKVPVYAGAAQALRQRFPPGWVGHGANGIGGVMLPSGPPAAQGDAAEIIRVHLSKAPHPLTLVALAPVTNLALALTAEPALAPKIKEIVILSGARGRGNATDAAEFNARCDPEALAVVLRCGAPLTLATIETVRAALATPERIAALRASGEGRALGIVADILAALPRSSRFGGAGAAIYDPVVIAWLIRPELFDAVWARITVDVTPGRNRGRTLIEAVGKERRASDVRLLTALDPEGFFALLGERLARLP